MAEIKIDVVWGGVPYVCTPVTVPAPAPEEAPEALSDPWDEDLAGVVPRRTDLARWPRGLWDARKAEQISEITVHHIGSTANWRTHSAAYLNKRDASSNGRPAPPYSVWIETDGTVRKLLHLTEANWHDHDWPNNIRRLSVGLNGALHKTLPTEAQLAALVRVCVWAIRHPEMRVTRAGIRGHMDIVSTQCPGWTAGGKDRWRAKFFDMLDRALEQGS